MAVQKIYYRLDDYIVQYMDSADTSADLNRSALTSIFGWYESEKYGSFIATADYSAELPYFFAGTKYYVATPSTLSISAATGDVPHLGSSYHYGIWYLTSAGIGSSSILDAQNQGFIVNMTRYDSNACSAVSGYYGQTGNAPYTKGIFALWQAPSGGTPLYVGYSLFVPSGVVAGQTLNGGDIYELWSAGSGEYSYNSSDVVAVTGLPTRGAPIISFPDGQPSNVGATTRMRISDLRSAAYYAKEMWVMAFEINAAASAMQAGVANYLNSDHCWVKKVSRTATGNTAWASGLTDDQPFVRFAASDGNYVELNVQFPSVGTWEVKVLESSKNLASKPVRVESKKGNESHFMVYARASSGGGIPSGTGNEPGYIHYIMPTSYTSGSPDPNYYGSSEQIAYSSSALSTAFPNYGKAWFVPSGSELGRTLNSSGYEVWINADTTTGSCQLSGKTTDNHGYLVPLVRPSGSSGNAPGCTALVTGGTEGATWDGTIRVDFDNVSSATCTELHFKLTSLTSGGTVTTVNDTYGWTVTRQSLVANWPEIDGAGDPTTGSFYLTLPYGHTDSDYFMIEVLKGYANAASTAYVGSAAASSIGHLSYTGFLGYVITTYTTAAETTTAAAYILSENYEVRPKYYRAWYPTDWLREKYAIGDKLYPFSFPVYGGAAELAYWTNPGCTALGATGEIARRLVGKDDIVSASFVPASSEFNVKFTNDEAYFDKVDSTIKYYTNSTPAYTGVSFLPCDPTLSPASAYLLSSAGLVTASMADTWVPTVPANLVADPIFSDSLGLSTAATDLATGSLWWERFIPTASKAGGFVVRVFSYPDGISRLRFVFKKDSATTGFYTDVEPNTGPVITVTPSDLTDFDVGESYRAYFLPVKGSRWSREILFNVWQPMAANNTNRASMYDAVYRPYEWMYHHTYWSSLIYLDE